MNSKQKFAFLMGVIAIAMIGLYPPWKEAGPNGLPLQYGPIFAPPIPLHPERGMEIDFVRLLLQTGVAAILTSGLVAAAAAPPSAGGQRPPAESPFSAALTQAMQAQAAQAAQQRAQVQIDAVQVEEEEEEEEEEDDDEDEEDDADVEDAPNVIRLPSGKTYGEFLVESADDPDYWESLTEARGVVKLPPGKRVQLEVKSKKDVDLSFVAMMTPATLHSVDLSESGVKDWELAHLQKLTDLKELDLSSTEVSSQSLSYLKGLDKLEKLWLDGTQVDDSCIEELKNLSSLKKLSLKETKFTADGIKQLEEKLSDCKVET